MPGRRHIHWFVILFAAAFTATAAAEIDLTDRLIKKVEIRGASPANQQFIENQIRVQPGQAYNDRAVKRDIANITRLGRFATVNAEFSQNPDGTINIFYVVREHPLLADVQVVGNKALSDEELLATILLRTGDPRDDYLINRAARNIVKAYKNEGYFLAEATVDRQALAEQNVLIFRVREGPYIEIEAIRFEGNQVYSDDLLEAQIRTRTKLLGLFGDAALSDEMLTQDVDRVRSYYRDRGYLEVRVGRDIQLNATQDQATVTFLIDEGRRFTVGRISVEGNALHSTDQIIEAMTLKRGGIYAANQVQRSTEAVRDLYGKLGFIDTRVQITSSPQQGRAAVDVVVRIAESKQYLVGNVLIRGNTKTRDKVIRRQLRGLEPGRPFDSSGVELTERRLRGTQYFSESDIVIQPPGPDELYRDVVVEVKEQQTGSVSFGAAVGSDSGVSAAIDLQQRNFDISDTPESFEEFISGDAFLGGGQFFQITLQPGDEVSRYAVSWREPYFFDSSYSFEIDLFFRERVFSDYDEQRMGGSIGFGKAFGDVWSAAVFVRYELIEIGDIDVDAPVDVFDVEGDSTLDAIGVRLVRDTTDSRLFPTEGSRWVLSLTQFGGLGGDYTFTRVASDFDIFWTVHEDFFGRKSVLRLRWEVGWNIQDDEAPVFERFYAGGHRTFRGFDFRGIGPRGIRNDTGTLGDDPVGGDFMWLLGLEYNFPVFEDFVRWVVFVDTGTVNDELSLSNYRVSVGTGVRLQLPILGQAPLAIDVAIPVLKEETDEERLLSFSLALPF